MLTKIKEPGCGDQTLAWSVDPTSECVLFSQ